MKNVFSLALIVLAGLAAAQLYPVKVGLTGTMSLRLSEPRYQMELKVDESQGKDISGVLQHLASVQESLSKEISRSKPDQYAAIQQRQEQAEIEAASKIIGLLTAPQRGRLMELALQETGPFAMRNAEVAKRIGLTNEQRTKLNAIAAKTIATQDELHAKLGAQLEAVPPGKSGDKKREAIMKSFEPKLKQAETQAESQVLALLTATQKQAWKKALGAPFK